MVFTSAIIFVLAVQGAPQAPPAVGAIAGCASDTMLQRLPGVAIIAKSGRGHSTATADAAGCYELKDLPSGSYRVTARLPGFDNVSRNAVEIVSGSVARLDFTLRVSAICECVRLGGTTLAAQWTHADAVLHARLSASKSQPATPIGYYRHVATPLEALKSHAAALEMPVFVLQNQRSGAPGPYDDGQQLVMFSGVVGFKRAHDRQRRAWPGPAGKPRSCDGVSHSGRPHSSGSVGFSRYVGMPLAAFLDELRALSRGK